MKVKGMHLLVCGILFIVTSCSRQNPPKMKYKLYVSPHGYGILYPYNLDSFRLEPMHDILEN